MLSNKFVVFDLYILSFNTCKSIIILNEGLKLYPVFIKE